MTVIPMRAEPSHCSEMVSQLLFGETYAVLETLDEWVRVRCHHDDYEGWIQRKQCFELTDSVLQDYLRVNKLRLSVPFVASGVRVPNMLSMGALMVTEPERSPVPEHAPIPNAESWWPAEGVPDISRVQRMELLRKLALSLLGTPYLWGGRTPLGIDCSGFVQEARLGDLAFLHNEEGRVVHVGLVLGDGKIIHSSGQVRIDRLDETGIFNEEQHRYSHQLRVIVRI